MSDPADTYARVEQPDIAALVSSTGIAYQCHVWKDVARNSIESAIFAEQEHGQYVLIAKMQIDIEDEEELVDCPRVIRSGDLFVALWLTYTVPDTGELNMATLDVTTLNTQWEQQGAISTDPGLLFDVVEPEEGGAATTDFIVVHKVDDTTIAVRRHDAADWISTDWIEIYSPGWDIQDRVLGAFWNHGGGQVIVSYVPTDGESNETLRTASFDEGDGSLNGDEQTFPEHDTATEYANVGHCLSADGTIAVFCEVQFDPRGSGDNDEVLLAEQAYGHAVAYRDIQAATAEPQDEPHYNYNLNLVSRPWAVNSSATTREVYALCSFKSSRSDLNNEQRYYFVLNFDHRLWPVIGGPRIHPRVCATFNRGTADGRRTARSPSVTGNLSPNVNSKRMNHLSHIGRPPPFGPDARTVTLSVVAWTRTTVSGVEADGGGTPRLKPGGASIEGIRFYNDDPWTVARADEVVAPADRNFVGPYPWAAYQTVEYGAGLFIAGGAPSIYEGQTNVELNFPWYPEIVAFDTDTGTGLDAGTYFWTVTYEWTDGRGQLHQSRPATPWQDTIENNGDVAYLTVRTMTISAKDCQTYYPGSRINLVLWRSDSNNATIFRRVYATGEGVGANWALSETPINDPAGLTGPHAGSYQVVADGNAAGRGDLLPYQFASGTWSPLTPDPPPSGTVAALFRDRIFTGNGEVPWRLNYSKRILPASGSVRFEAPAFNPVLFYDLEVGQQVVAMLAMDSQLVVWTTQRVYILDGDPVGDDGSPGTLQARVMHNGTGCINPESVVLGPPGAFFQSRKGYYLLTRGFDLDYISAGADIEEAIRIAGQIRSATLLEDRHQIRLVACADMRSDPVVLVYDYFHRLWARRQLQGTVLDEDESVDEDRSAPAHGIAWRGLDTDVAHVVLQWGGLLVERRTDDADTFVDDDASGDGLAVRATLQTGWIHLGGISGYQFVNEIVVQLEKMNDSAVSVYVEYTLTGSYESAEEEEYFYFPEPADARLRLRPTFRKITAFRLRIDEPASAFRVHTFVISGTATAGVYSIGLDGPTDVEVSVTASATPEDDEVPLSNIAIAEGLESAFIAAASSTLAFGSAIYEITRDGTTIRLVYQPNNAGYEVESVGHPGAALISFAQRDGVPTLENLKIISMAIVAGVLPGSGRGSVRAQGV